MFKEVDILRTFNNNEHSIDIIGIKKSTIYFKINLYKLVKKYPHLNLFRMGFFGGAHGWGVKQNLLHISYNDETWHSYTLPKNNPKNIWTTWHNPWVPLTSAIFHRKSANFAISTYRLLIICDNGFECENLSRIRNRKTIATTFMNML